MRLDSCMSVPLSFVNKTNLCLILSSSSSKISDNHSGPYWGWKNHHAGIHICTICDGESCVVIDQSYTLNNTHTHKYIDINIYTNTQMQTYTQTQKQSPFFSVSHKHTSLQTDTKHLESQHVRTHKNMSAYPGCSWYNPHSHLIPESLN